MAATEIWGELLSDDVKFQDMSKGMSGRSWEAGKITKYTEAKELREWDLGQMSQVTFEISKNNDKKSDRKTEGCEQTNSGNEEK